MDEGAGGALRVAVACAARDPLDPVRFSGIPASLIAALRDLGVEPVPIAAEAPEPVHVAIVRGITLSRLRAGDVRDLRRALADHRLTAGSTSVLAASRSFAAAVAVRRAGRLHGLIQYGTEYAVPSGIPRVTYEDSTVRSAATSYAWPWLERRSARRLDHWAAYQTRRYAGAVACCFTSHWAARSAIEEHGVSEDRIRVVGIGHNHAPEAGDRDWGTPRFLFVGHDWARKNGDRLLRAFDRLRLEIPEATLDLVGGHPPVDRPGVTGHGPLHLDRPEERRQVEALFARATCFVLPSLHEPSAIAHVEAAAAGLASIGTTAGGVATIVGSAGKLVDPLDEDGLLAAMRELSDPEVAASLGAVARERSALFTWRAVAERLLDALGLRPATVPPL